jgi:hypothetical protein
MMLEEYLDGTEVDIDVVMSGKSAAYAKVTDNWPTLEPWFNETGDNAPSMFEKSQQHELMSLAVNTLRCMGLKLGVFHVEVRGLITSRCVAYTRHAAVTDGGGRVEMSCVNRPSTRRAARG